MSGAEPNRKVPDTIQQLAQREQVLVHSPDGRLWLIVRGKLNGCWQPAAEGDQKLASEFLETLRTSAADLRAWTVVGPFIEGGREGVPLDQVAAMAPPAPIPPMLSISEPAAQVGEEAAPAGELHPSASRSEFVGADSLDPGPVDAGQTSPADLGQALATVPEPDHTTPELRSVPSRPTPVATGGQPVLEPYLADTLRHRLLAITPLTAVVDRVMAVVTGPGDAAARIAELERLRGERYLFCSPALMAQLVKTATDTLESLIRHQRR